LPDVPGDRTPEESAEPEKSGALIREEIMQNFAPSHQFVRGLPASLTPGRLGGRGLFLGIFLGNEFLDFGALTDFFPDIVQLGPADTAGAGYFNPGNPGGMNGEYPFNTNAVGIFPHRKGFAHPGIFHRYNQTFVDLDPFGLAFNDLEMDLYTVPNLKIINFALHLGFFNGPNFIHFVSTPL
jgi:hypothetical protein